MDSLSLFQSMQGNVNPMGAYAAGSKLANDMLAIQSKQAQQVFQNLYNSAQQAENRRQFEQTMAFKQQELQDQSARGWFNAKTQRMAYDPNRGQTEGPPISAMQPKVTDLGRGILSVAVPGRNGLEYKIITGADTPESRSLPPAGIITANQAQQQPSAQQPSMPASGGEGLYSPNPPMDSSLFQDSGPVQTVPDNPLLPALPGNQTAPQIPLAPIAPVPSADVITRAPANPQQSNLQIGMTQPSPSADVIMQNIQNDQSLQASRALTGEPGTIGYSTPSQLSGPSTPSWINPQPPVVTAQELQPRQQKQQDNWPRINQPPEVIHDGFGGLMKKGRGPQGEKTVQYGTINPNGEMRFLGQPQVIPERTSPLNTFQIDTSNPQSIEAVASLVSQYSDRVDMSATIADGKLSLALKPLSGSGGSGVVRDINKAKNVSEFIGAIPDAGLREKATTLYGQMIDPTNGGGDVGLRDEIMAEKGIEEAAVTPAMINERKSAIRLEKARELSAFSAGLSGGALPWNGPQGLLEQAGFMVKQPPPSPNGTTSPAPQIVPLPKTPEEIALETKAKEKADAILKGWNSVQENFGSRLLRDERGNVRYTEDQLDGVASGIYRDPVAGSRRRTEEGFQRRSYMDDILSKLQLTSDAYPGTKRPGASIFTDLRPEEVALAWAKDRLMRKGILDSEGRFASKAAQEFNSGGAKIKSIEPIP
jgi:hypothetical protein